MKPSVGEILVEIKKSLCYAESQFFLSEGYVKTVRGAHRNYTASRFVPDFLNKF